MKTNYQDIISRLGEPLWWDSFGAPHYETFKPYMLQVYFDAVALMQVSCQSCRRQFLVASTIESYSLRAWTDIATAIYQRVKKLLEIDGVISRELLVKAMEQHLDDVDEIIAPKAYSDDAGMFHYGDPPIHNCPGDTQNSTPIRVIEFWEKNPDLNGDGPSMLRKREHEVLIAHPSKPYENIT